MLEYLSHVIDCQNYSWELFCLSTSDKECTLLYHLVLTILFSSHATESRAFIQNRIGKNIFRLNTVATYRIPLPDKKTKRLPTASWTHSGQGWSHYTCQATRKLCRCTPHSCEILTENGHIRNGCFMGVTHGKIIKVNFTLSIVFLRNVMTTFNVKGKPLKKARNLF